MEVVREDQKNGPSNIWVAQSVDTQTIGDIMDKLRRTHLRDNLVPLDRLHITHAWIIETRRFIDILEQHCGQLDPMRYQEERDNLLADLSDMSEPGLLARARKLEVVGRRRRAVAVVLEPTSKLRLLRKPIMDRIKTFASRLGAEFPRRVLREDESLSRSVQGENSSPHVTVARSNYQLIAPEMRIKGMGVDLTDGIVEYTNLRYPS
jgi:hypothetical protein